MTDTEMKVQGILQELQSGEKAETVGAKEIAERLLGRIPGGVSKRSDAESSIDRELLEERIRDVNDKWEVPYYRPILVYRRAFHRLSTFFKRLVRRLLKFLLLPILEDQVHYNEASKDALNALYGDTVSIDITLRGMQKTIREQQQQIEELQRRLAAIAPEQAPAEDGKAAEEA